MHLLFIIELSLPAPRVLPSGQQRNAFAAHDGLSPARSVVAQCRREAVAYGDRIAVVVLLLLDGSLPIAL